VIRSKQVGGLEGHVKDMVEPICHNPPLEIKIIFCCNKTTDLILIPTYLMKYNSLNIDQCLNMEKLI
jgi:hypothetical protein